MKKFFDRPTHSVTVNLEVGGLQHGENSMAKWIAVVRHPQKEDDLDGIHRGDAARITEQGSKDADTLVKRASLMDVDLVISSDCPRTFELATRIGNVINRPVETNALFREWRKPSFMEGRSVVADEAVREAKRLIRESFDDDLQFLDGECRSAIEARTRKALAYIMEYPCKRLLVVSHAGFIAGMLTMTVWDTLVGYYQGPDQAFKLDNTGVTIFTQEANRRDGSNCLVVKTVNDVSHRETQVYEDLYRILGGAV